MNPPVKRVLVIQTAFIGDIIMSTPLFKGIRQACPDAEIDVVVNSRYAALLANNPYISRIFGFDKSRMKLWNLLKLIRAIRNNHYDVALSMQIHMSSSLMMYMGGIKTRIGFPRQAFITHPVSPVPGLHVRDRAGLLLNKLKEGTYDLQTQLFPSAYDEEVAGNFVRNNGKFKLGIAPGSVWETKKWPKEYYIEVVRKLAGTVDIYLIGGGSDDISLCKEIVEKVNAPSVYDTSGKLTLLQSTALIARLDLLLCNDSAPMHMANAVETNVLAIFGPTVRQFGCYPYQPGDRLIDIELYCRPCSKHGGNTCPEGHFRCMKDILPDRIVAEIKKSLKQSAPAVDKPE